ncbi:hypothetical protein ACVSQB_17580, partial [Bradyrhizobium elkanii]
HIGSQTQQPIAHRLPTPPDGVSLPLTAELPPVQKIRRILSPLAPLLERDGDGENRENDHEGWNSITSWL